MQPALANKTVDVLQQLLEQRLPRTPSDHDAFMTVNVNWLKKNLSLELQTWREGKKVASRKELGNQLCYIKYSYIRAFFNLAIWRFCFQLEFQLGIYCYSKKELTVFCSGNRVTCNCYHYHITGQGRERRALRAEHWEVPAPDKPKDGSLMHSYKIRDILEGSLMGARVP